MVREVTKSEIAGEFQMDLFDSPMGGRVKNDRTLMVWSFFGLGRQKTQRLPTYDNGTVRIEVYGTPVTLPRQTGPGATFVMRPL